jgi:chromosome segregation ATPase
MSGSAFVQLLAAARRAAAIRPAFWAEQAQAANEAEAVAANDRTQELRTELAGVRRDLDQATADLTAARAATGEAIAERDQLGRDLAATRQQLADVTAVGATSARQNSSSGSTRHDRRGRDSGQGAGETAGARRPDNSEVAGSNPVPATEEIQV